MDTVATHRYQHLLYDYIKCIQFHDTCIGDLSIYLDLLSWINGYKDVQIDMDISTFICKHICTHIELVHNYSLKI